MKHIKLYEQQNNGAYFGGQDGEIYSIRRKKDGEIFTIGDVVKFDNKTGSITGFYLNVNKWIFVITDAEKSNENDNPILDQIEKI